MGEVEFEHGAVVEPQAWPPARFQILSLDGGGIRGVYIATALAALERDLGTRVVDHFDLITGTSTGGIIALGLALGCSPGELVNFYKDEASEIFPAPRRPSRRFFGLLRSKYNGKALERAVRLVFGDRTIGDAERALVIPSYNLDEGAPVALKTGHHPSFTRDPRIPAWKAAMATTAAPTYLPASSSISGARYVDGGVWANNPAVVGIVEAKRFIGIPLEALKVLSIGTGSVVEERSAALTRGGAWTWRRDAHAVLLRAQAEGTQEIARLLLEEKQLVRVNPAVPKSWKELDVLRSEFASQGEEDAKRLAPRFASEFMPHRARTFDEVRAGVLSTHAEIAHAD